MSRVVRRQNEGDLGEIEFLPKRLHRFSCDATSVCKDGQGISAERMVGKHVDAVVMKSSHFLDPLGRWSQADGYLRELSSLILVRY